MFDAAEGSLPSALRDACRGGFVPSFTGRKGIRIYVYCTGATSLQPAASDQLASECIFPSFYPAMEGRSSSKRGFTRLLDSVRLKFMTISTESQSFDGRLVENGRQAYARGKRRFTPTSSPFYSLFYLRRVYKNIYTYLYIYLDSFSF